MTSPETPSAIEKLNEAAELANLPQWGDGRGFVVPLFIANRIVAGLEAKVAESEALAVENESAFKAWRRRCETAEAKVADLEAAQFTKAELNTINVGLSKLADHWSVDSEASRMYRIARKALLTADALEDKP